MAYIKAGLIFVVVTLSFGVYSTSLSEYDYCVVGAGPGGITLTEFCLKFSGAHYVSILIV